VIDHNVVRANYRAFHQHMPGSRLTTPSRPTRPRKLSAAFTRSGRLRCASLAESAGVREHQGLRQRSSRFHLDKIIFANPTKPRETLEALDQYKPLVTFDNLNELKKFKRLPPHAGVVLRLRCPTPAPSSNVVQIRGPTQRGRWR